MRKILALVIFLLLIACAYFAYAHFSGGTVPTFGLPIGGEKAKIREQTKKFFEGIKFKNSEELKKFIDSNLSTNDLNSFLDKTFEIDHERIDLKNFSLEDIEIDSQKTRAKIRVNVVGTDQGNATTFKKSKVIYLYFDKESMKWMVDINHISL